MTRSRSPFDPPLATYRLQLHRGFTFDQATEILPYLERLGISHVYCSPFLMAHAGSTHGYDVVDYSRINPDLGDDASFARFCAALDAHALGLILDFVPNHMGIGHADNGWWLDVLEWGPASPYGRYFDIDWSPQKHDLHGKLLLPILGGSYGATLASGDITLRFDADAGRLDFWYFDNRLPLHPRDYPGILGTLAQAPTIDRAIGLLQDGFLAEAEPRYLRSVADTAKEALKTAARDPAFAARVEEQVASWLGTKGDPASWTRLHDLLQRQAFRLAHWRTASDEINYRRFFDVENLAGMRMERIAVFRDSHEFIGRLLADGILHGLRIDHVDGLADPQQYCRRLNAFAAAIVPRDSAGRRLRPYILVEKILIGDEKLPSSWPISGTTGYDYLAMINGLFIEPTGYAKLQRHWSRFTGITIDLPEEVYQCRRMVIDRSLASEMTYLVDWLVDIAEADWFTRDFTRKRLRDALVEIVAGFAVYRTYVTERGASDMDRREIDKAITSARQRWIGADAEILDFVQSLLTLDVARKKPDHYAAKRDSIRRFVARFQQYTGAIAAKSVEDTFFYRHVPLVSANEVGATPYRPTTSINEFHAINKERLAAWPNAMLASATHDTKRGEDTRTRLDVLSEMPDEWARRVSRWHIYNRAHRTDVAGVSAPSLNDEYLLYQSIVGTWPMQAGGLLRSEQRRHEYIVRLQEYAIKASREAKLATAWTAPNEAYETALLTFIERIIQPSPFLDSLFRFLPAVTRLGAYNGLSQLVLKATLPGVPDFYQGTEFWDLSLVDPDNRRPVDFTAREAALTNIDFPRAVNRWREGWLKLFVAHRLLALRSEMPALFRTGGYEPLVVEGMAANSVIAFERRHESQSIVVIVGRNLGTIVRGELSAFWPDNALKAGASINGIRAGQWTDVLSGRRLDAASGMIDAAAALAALPVAVLRADANAEGR